MIGKKRGIGGERNDTKENSSLHPGSHKARENGQYDWGAILRREEGYSPIEDKNPPAPMVRTPIVKDNSSIYISQHPRQHYNCISYVFSISYPHAVFSPPISSTFLTPVQDLKWRWTCLPQWSRKPHQKRNFPHTFLSNDLQRKVKIVHHCGSGR